MDELEDCVFLSRAHAAAITGSDTDHVLVAGGSRGVLRFYVVRYEYILSGSGKKAKGSHAFACEPLLIMNITGEDATRRTLVPQMVGGHAVAPAPPKKAADGGEEVHMISSILYMPNRQHSQLVAITADQTFCCYELQGSVATATAAATPSKGSKKKKAAASSSSSSDEVALVLNRQLVGTHDDILDICCLPTVDQRTQKKDYLLAIASNSPHIRLTNMLTRSVGAAASASKTGAGAGEEATSVLLYGHTDIVLALDGSPDGYVTPLVCFFSVCLSLSLHLHCSVFV